LYGLYKIAEDDVIVILFRLVVDVKNEESKKDDEKPDKNILVHRVYSWVFWHVCFYHKTLELSIHL
jgi:hypothetical protein